MPLAGGRFDLVVDFGTLYHISSPQVALTEISRVLRRGGLFVHETRFSQLLAHPLRGGKHALPWSSVPELATWKSNALWAARQKISA
jgi:ubiquinone/menaquinone biosynthesis C-methylase UbiE